MLRTTLFILLLTQCSLATGQQPDSLTYAAILRNSRTDTTTKVLIENQRQDSKFTCSYVNFWSYRADEFSADTTTFIFPQNQDTLNHTHLFDTRIFKIDDRPVKVYKFLFDFPAGSDEETLYFYCIEYGILVTKSVAWGSYDRIIDMGDNGKTKVVQALVEQIISDEEFFTKWF